MNSIQKKIKVVHYCNQLGLGGTERTMQIFCNFLDRNIFEVHALSRLHVPPLSARLKVGLGTIIGNSKARGKQALWQSMNARVSRFTEILGADHVHLAPTDNALASILAEINPSILHVHYSGRAEFPTSNEAIMSHVLVTVTTNQFEIENTAASHRFVKRMYFVSQWMLDHKALWAKNDARSRVMYNPIERPEVARASADLRTELGIPANAFVVGRVGRADPGIHDPISLRAYREIQNDDTYFLALSAPLNMIQEAQSMGLKNFRALPPTTDSMWLSRFYNTLSVLAHARRDGETFGCNIGEAMIHGVPVVTHLTDYMNAQEETAGAGGVVCQRDDVPAYAAALKRYRDDPAFYAEKRANALSRAQTEFEAGRLTARLSADYLKLLNI